jgi:lipopolysaccharide export system protein LptC
VSSENLYSRLVYWLKILLPLAALGILSSVVFFARDADESRTIPFVAQEGSPGAGNERLTRPEYVAVTRDGSAITLHAVQVRPVDGDPRTLDVETVEGEIVSGDGRTLNASAPTARVDLKADRADLAGEVVVRTSDGYDFLAHDLTTRLDVTDAESAGPVSGTAPFGTLEAGAMRYTAPSPNQSLLIFQGGVKLVYEPGNREAEQ